MRPGPKIAYMRIGSATNSRTVYSSYLRGVPAGDSVFFFLPSADHLVTALAVVGVFGSFTYDAVVRARLGGLNLSEFLMVETPLPATSAAPRIVPLVARLNLAHDFFSPEWLELRRHGAVAVKAPKSSWAVTAHERGRIRAQLDAIVASEFGLEVKDLKWILKDCDHPSDVMSQNSFSRDP